MVRCATGAGPRHEATRPGGRPGVRARVPPAEVERATRTAAWSMLGLMAERIGRRDAPRVEIGPIALRLEHWPRRKAPRCWSSVRAARETCAAFFGSVSGAVLRSARCPVVVVSPAIGQASGPRVRRSGSCAGARRARWCRGGVGGHICRGARPRAHAGSRAAAGLAGTTVPGPRSSSDGPAMTPERLALGSPSSSRGCRKARGAARPLPGEGAPGGSTSSWTRCARRSGRR